jgi:hypothetical protein
MGYVRGFAPWIAFAAISSVGWQWGALAGLVIGLWLIIQNRRAGVAADALILEISTVCYFVVLTAVAFAFPHSPVHHYSGALSFAWLAVISWGGLAIRRPFTLGIAKRTTPPEFWDKPQFLRINNVITIAWATSFALTAIAVAACVLFGAGTIAAIVFQVVGFVVPAVFTARYPKIARARLAALANANS